MENEWKYEWLEFHRWLEGLEFNERVVDNDFTMKHVQHWYIPVLNHDFENCKNKHKMNKYYEDYSTFKN